MSLGSLIGAYAIAVLALLISAASLLIALRFSDTAMLSQRVTTQENDLTELSDRVHHWMRRDSVRRVRGQQGGEPVAPPTTQHPKAALFARARDVLQRGNKP